MKLKISTRLSIALAAMGVVVAGVTVVTAQYNFRRGFLGYLNDQGFEQLTALVPTFERAYAQHGSWDFMTRDRRVWFEFVQSKDLYTPGPVPALPRRPPTVIMTGLYLRMSLMDTSFHRLVGAPEANRQTPRLPIRVNGSTVGWLAVLPFESVTGPADLRFQRRQYVSTWFIAGGSILLAALIALLLTRSLATPLQRIARALHRLAGGEYATRLELESRDEIGQLAGDFNDLARTLERNEKMRRSFMADISHELRTPLTVLQGLIEATEDGVREPNRETLLSLKGEVATMSKLVGDLYELSLTDQGALAYRKATTDIGEVLRLTLGAFRERLAERSLTVDCDIPARVAAMEADEARLHQLFNNVLENAVRYTDPGGTVRIRLTEHDGQILIDFEDSAPGVPEGALKQLFKRFYRVESSRSRATGGAGLGLTICSNIVEAHGGTISAHPSTLGGLWIRIAFPFVRIQAA